MTAGEWWLTLPLSTPLSLNHRMHHQVRAKRTREVREMALLLARAAKIPHCERVRVTLVYTPKDSRVRDPLNLVATLKACEDGLVDAGVVDDDNPRYVESVMPLIDVAEPKLVGGRLALLVERML